MDFRLSVIIPVRNGEATIKRALDSIVKQQFKYPYEVILIDDDSEDNTVDIAKDYLFKLPIAIYKSNYDFHSPGNSMRSGLDHATGDWITYLDADDEFTDDALNTAFRHIDEDNLEYVCCLGIQASEDGNVWDLWESDAWIHGKFYNREFLKFADINFLGKSFCEDTDFNMQVLTILFANKLTQNLGFSYYPERGYIWYQQSESVTHKTEEINGVVYPYYDIHFGDYMDAHFGRLVDLCIILSEDNMTEELDGVLPLLLEAFLSGYFHYQTMLYRTYFHPLDENIRVMARAKVLS